MAEVIVRQPLDNHDETRPNTDDFILALTMKGRLMALDRRNGLVLWTLQDPDGPLVRNRARTSSKSGMRRSADEPAEDIYLVEPTRDGPLYVVQSGRKLRKLPITLKTLVEVSPFRSPDGLVYIGNKHTQLVAVDLDSGQILDTYETDSGSRPMQSEQQYSNGRRTIFLGRVEYQVVMYDEFDSQRPRWNVSFVEYQSADVAYDLSSRPMNQRFGLGVDGSIVSLGKFSWTRRLEAPIVSLFDIEVAPSGVPVVVYREPVMTKSLPTEHASNALYHVGSLAVAGGEHHEDRGAIMDGLYVLKSERYLESTQIPRLEPATDVNSIPIKQDVWDEVVEKRDICPTECVPGSPSYPGCVLGPYDYDGIYPLEPTDLIPFPEPIQLIPSPVTITIGPGPSAVVPAQTAPFWNVNVFITGLSLLFSTVVLFYSFYRRDTPVQNNNPSSEDSKSDSSSKKKKKKARSASEKAGDVETIGQLEISKDVIGYGSHGTVVYKGVFHGRPIAVKRLLVDFYDIAHHEVDLLLKSDHHPNVIQYYCKEQAGKFLYIGLELCEASIYDIYEGPSSRERLEPLRKQLEHRRHVLLKDIARGLKHLHDLNIVHRDVKPANILINSSLRAIISDFGLCKKLTDDQSSFGVTAVQSGGTAGWRAPETIWQLGRTFADDTTMSLVPVTQDEQNARLTRAVDVFSAGLVFGYVLMNGHHPFGDRLVREQNIIRGVFDILPLERQYRDFDAIDLISKMLPNRSQQRISMDEVLSHPYFWNSTKKLMFLQDMSDRLDVEDKASSSLLKAFEPMSKQVFGTSGWHSKVDRELFENLGKYRKYQSDSLQDLLRAMRNKKNHYLDLPVDVQELLGSIPDGFYEYFQTRFPRMLVVCYNFMLEQSELQCDPLFSQYLMPDL